MPEFIIDLDEERRRRGDGGGGDGRPTVEIRPGELPFATDAVEAHLIADGCELYQHGTRLVRVGQWQSAPGPTRRPSGAGVLVDVGVEWLQDYATRRLAFQRWDRRASDFRPTDCPRAIAATLLARLGDWRFPVLSGFADSPTLDLKGRIVHQPGYDEASGLYLSHPPALGPIETTARHHAEGAGMVLRECFSTFPFVSPADESACFAALLTALLRRVLPTAPLIGISASTPGTGKSKLVDVISTIVTGRHASVVGLGHTPEELEKRIDAILLKGDTIAAFDNVDRAVRSDTLCQVATQPTKSIRVLALSKVVEAPTNVALFLTGNNLTLLGDLVRRVVMVTIDAEVERPEQRHFERDAVEYALEQRSALITAALTLVKTYLDAGAPPVLLRTEDGDEVRPTPYGSFEVWDRMVRRPLIWAGFPDPLEPAADLREADHELALMGDFLRVWREATNEPVTAAELRDLILEKSYSMGDQALPKYPELHEYATMLFGEPHRWGARDLGYRLRGIQERWYAGLRVQRQRKGMRGVRWYVQARGEPKRSELQA